MELLSSQRVRLWLFWTVSEEKCIVVLNGHTEWKACSHSREGREIICYGCVSNNLNDVLSGSLEKWQRYLCNKCKKWARERSSHLNVGKVSTNDSPIIMLKRCEQVCWNYSPNCLDRALMSPATTRAPVCLRADTERQTNIHIHPYEQCTLTTTQRKPNRNPTSWPGLESRTFEVWGSSTNHSTSLHDHDRKSLNNTQRHQKDF